MKKDKEEMNCKGDSMELKLLHKDFSVCKVENYSQVNLDAEYWLRFQQFWQKTASQFLQYPHTIPITF